MYLAIEEEELKGIIIEKLQERGIEVDDLADIEFEFDNGDIVVKVDID
jgi:hypothetical protein